MKKVLHIDFTGAWEKGGCHSHIAKAWVRNAQRYEFYFAGSVGEGYRGTVEGRPHYGFDENKLANRIYNKILQRKKFCWFSLIPIIEEIKPDIIHFHNRHFLVDQIMAKLSYRPKVVCIYHWCYNDLPIPKAADLLIGVGKFVVAWIDRRADPSVPMAVLHNPFSKTSAPPHQEKGKTLFLNYSNLPRGTRDLFDAVRKVRAEGHDFDMWSVGHLYRDLPVPEGVHTAKFVPQPEFLEIMSRSSAYICTSYGTPFSVAVVEAIARRIPVICPWDIGAFDLLPADSVISFEAHSATALTEALRKFFAMSEEERSAMAERAYTAAVAAYDEALVTAKLERLYDGLFAQSVSRLSDLN